jgi:hypothetical protein
MAEEAETSGGASLVGDPESMEVVGVEVAVEAEVSVEEGADVTGVLVDVAAETGACPVRGAASNGVEEACPVPSPFDGVWFGVPPTSPPPLRGEELLFPSPVEGRVPPPEGAAAGEVAAAAC